MQYTENSSQPAIAAAVDEAAIRETVRQMEIARAVESLAAKRGATCVPGSAWSKKYAEQSRTAQAAIASADANLGKLNGRDEADRLRFKVTQLSLDKFRVLDKSKTPSSVSGRYPEVVDQLLWNEVLICFFQDAEHQGVPVRSGFNYNVTMPGCRCFEVEVH